MSGGVRSLGRLELGAALRAWSYFCGTGEPLRQALPTSLAWLRACWEAGHDHLPLALVHDLGYLLLRGRDFSFASTRSLGEWPEGERAARLSYEDRVLGRWALDPTVLEAHVTIAGMAAPARQAAVAHAVALALADPLRAMIGVTVGNPAHLRALAGEVCADAPEGFAAPLVDVETLGWARGHLDACAAALPPGRLFDGPDLWEIAHLVQLPSESARLALREIHQAAARIGRLAPQIAGHLERRAREVPVAEESADHYPTGGFDAISTRGSFENLVRSEIAYVGEAKEATDGRFDLFDLRWAEAELLYYTRDESPLFDVHRDVAVVIDRPAELRHKPPALPAQTLVLVEGCALALHADLLQLFGRAGSHLRLTWRAGSDEDRDVAAEEMALMRLALAAEIAHRRVELSLVQDWAALPPSRARIVFSPRPPEPRVACVAWVRVGDDHWAQRETATLADHAGLRRVVDELVATIY